MNHWLIRGFTAGALALALAAGSPALAHGGGTHGGLADPARVLHALDLSADQKQQITDIVSAHRATLGPLMQNARTARQAIADKLFGTGSVSEQDLDTLAQQAEQARTAVTHERLALVLAVRGVLTPAQIENASTIHDGLKQLRAQERQLLGGTSAGGATD